MRLPVKARWLLGAGLLAGSLSWPAKGADPAGIPPRQSGTPFMRVWRAEDYGASPVNWRVLQDPRTGFIYVGNAFGILEYDGAGWRLIPMPREGSVRSMVVDRQGGIWAAGYGDIARLEPDATGSLRAVDQTGRVPAAERGFGTLTHALAAAEGVYLSGERRILLFRDDGTVVVWRTEGLFGTVWQYGGQAVVYRDQRELVALQPDGGLKGVVSPDHPDRWLLQVNSAEPDGAGWLLFTRYGPARWSGGAAPAAPLWQAGFGLPADDEVRATRHLADGRFALATQHGVLIYGREGGLEQRLDIAHGLPVNTVNGIGEDRQGGLWLALQTGLARAQLDSPFALHGLAQGLDGGPRRMASFGGRLYVAQGGGVSWRNPADGRFQTMAGVASGANRPVVVRDRLLVTTAVNLNEIDAAGRVSVVKPMGFLPMIESRRHPGWFFAGDTDSLWLFSPTRAPGPGWKLEGRLQNLEQSLVQIYDSNDGYVWMVTDGGAIWRADFRGGLRLDAPCTPFGEERGVPTARRRDHVELFLLGRDLYAVSAGWFLRYDAGSGRFAPAPLGLGAASSADAVENAEDGSVWLHSAGPDAQLVHLTMEAGAGAPRIQAYPAPALDGLVLNSLFQEPATHTLWIAGQGALVSMDLDWRSARRPAVPAALLRRVAAASGETLYAGPLAGRTGPLELSARQNDLRFEFARADFAPNYLGAVHTLFRSRIDGLEADWTRWSSEPFREVTNLPYRRLVFRLEARGPDGRIAPEARFALTILPPWWLSGPAWAAYALAAMVLVSGVVRLRTQALRQRALRLERLVAERTDELAETNVALAVQNLELDRLRQLEAAEKISARLAEEKARLEVLRYQLNPHFLFNALTSICAQLPAGLAGARATVERLTDFCQFTLFRPAGGENPTLAEEMKMLRAYLGIEQVRWGELLGVEIEIAAEVGEERLPPFLLLPLVENALKYGRATSRGAVKIRLAAQRDSGGALVIEVANTGEWVAAASDRSLPSLGIGLENLRQRLDRFYPHAHEFATTAEGGWVRVRLRLTNQAGIPVI